MQHRSIVKARALFVVISIVLASYHLLILSPTSGVSASDHRYISTIEPRLATFNAFYHDSAINDDQNDSWIDMLHHRIAI